jgi:hypothetical protein
MNAGHTFRQPRAQPPDVRRRLQRGGPEYLDPFPERHADSGRHRHRQGAQNVTRMVALSIGAPPAFAATAPSSARNSRDAMQTADQRLNRRHDHQQKRQCGADRERARRRERGLNGPRRCCRRYAEFVALVRAQRIAFHELLRDSVRQIGI